MILWIYTFIFTPMLIVMSLQIQEENNANHFPNLPELSLWDTFVALVLSYLRLSHLEAPGAPWILSPGVGGHEGPLRESISAVVIIRPLT